MHANNSISTQFMDDREPALSWDVFPSAELLHHLSSTAKVTHDKIFNTSRVHGVIVFHDIGHDIGFLLKDSTPYIMVYTDISFDITSYINSLSFVAIQQQCGINYYM